MIVVDRDDDQGTNTLKGGGQRRYRGRCLEPRLSSVTRQELSRSLEYGVAILESFSGGRDTIEGVEIAGILGTSPTSAHRYATTLVALGFLERDSKRRYRLASGAAYPGAAAIGAIRQQIPARVALERLREETGHTVSMGVLYGGSVIYVYRLFGHRLGQYLVDQGLGVGVGVPAYCTALGKVLLASLSEAERRELLERLDLIPYGPRSIVATSRLAAELDHVSSREAVVSDEEFVRGGRSVAVLVPRPSGEYPLAIEVTVPSSAYDVDGLLKTVGPRLKRTARLISNSGPVVRRGRRQGRL